MPSILDVFEPVFMKVALTILNDQRKAEGKKNSHSISAGRKQFVLQNVHTG
jgi:hypothetical protein